MDNPKTGDDVVGRADAGEASITRHWGLSSGTKTRTLKPSAKARGPKQGRMDC